MGPMQRATIDALAAPFADLEDRDAETPERFAFAIRAVKLLKMAIAIDKMVSDVQNIRDMAKGKQPPQPKAGQISITIDMSRQQPNWDAMLAEMNAKYSGNVKITSSPLTRPNNIRNFQTVQRTAPRKRLARFCVYTHQPSDGPLRAVRGKSHGRGRSH